MHMTGQLHEGLSSPTRSPKAIHEELFVKEMYCILNNPSGIITQLDFPPEFAYLFFLLKAHLSARPSPPGYDLQHSLKE